MKPNPNTPAGDTPPQPYPPDLYQGLGIGSWLMETVAAIEHQRGFRVTITASHPAIVAHCSHSPRWRYLGLKKTGSTRQRYGQREIKSSRGRAVASFEFVGP